MIASTLDEAHNIAMDPLIPKDYDQFGAEVAGLCCRLMETVVDPEFPGALLPSVNASGVLSILVAAPTMEVWRRLNPILRAFAGPTLTSFDGLPRGLSQTDPIAIVVARSQPAAAGVIDLPHDDQARIAALRALVRVRETLARSPSLQRSAPEPTSWLLARFQDCLNVGRSDAAASILAKLKGELRLDALNLKFLEIQLLAEFGDWKGIVDLPGFANLCLARRTPVITALLLEALFQTHLATAFDRDDASETRARFEAVVRTYAQPMLTIPASPLLTASGWRIYGLEAWLDPSRIDICAALAVRRTELGWIADHIEKVALAEERASVPLAPLDDARAALLHVDAIESVDSVTAALVALGKLNPEELARLREAEPFRATLNVAEEVGRGGLPTSWIEWLSMAADPSFTSALEVARRGKDEWPIGEANDDPIAVQALVFGLDQAFSNDIATDRTAQALPFLVAWLRRDPDFPRSAMAPIYSNLLTLFALCSARGRVTYESSQILVNASLAVGLNSKSYHALIADVEELAGKGFGVSMIYWVLEIVEDFMRATSPDADAREKFLHSVLARITPIYNRLSTLQRAATSQLAHELGWTLESLGINSEAKQDEFTNKLRDLRIAIYSLTESASRQAMVALEQIEPTVIVDCNADHGGTMRLKALAEGADIFVMTWLSAKHAATDFIRDHRANRPLLYAQGRGFSSILRAIEDHFSTSSLSS